jgi:hypothetical protein
MNIKNIIKMEALIVAIAAICVCSLSFISCEDETKSGGRTAHDPSKPVVLTTFTPDSGRISEMVLLDGNNFGTDVSNIKVFFNAKEAKVLNSTGTRMLAFVPRLPGDTCVVSVEIGGKQYVYDNFFRYKIEASVTTLAGDGTNALTISSLDKSQFRPIYIGADKDFNIFLTIENGSGMLLKLNEQENSVAVLATNAHGVDSHCQPNAHPETGVIMLGFLGGGNRDCFVFLDPKEGWAPKMKYIKNWKAGEYKLPTNNGADIYNNHETHYNCLYCKADGCLYTRYVGGQLVKINPNTWEAEVIYQTNSGIGWSMAFHPVRTSELWMSYDHGQGGELSNSLCSVDVLNPAETFRKLSGATNGSYRDGRLDQAQFYRIRQINFDPDGNLFVGDNGNHCIRKVDTDNMMVETVIGIPGISGFKDGNKEEALFKELHGIVTDPDGIIYVSDYGNFRVRRIAIE